LHGNADVHVLRPLGLGLKLEVPVGAGEVQHHQVVVLGGGALGGGHVGADEVGHAGLQLHDHGVGVVGGGQEVAFENLGPTGLIPAGAGLGGADDSGQVGDGGGGGVGAGPGEQADEGEVVVAASHVHLLHAVGGHALAGDLGVHGSRLDRGGQG